MLKYNLPLMALLMSVPTLHAANLDQLTIAAGQTYQASGDLKLNQLIMEDGATLLAPEGIKEWRIEVKQAWLKGTSFINAYGQSGTGGETSPDQFGKPDEFSKLGKTAKCETGHPGNAGNAGTSGLVGITIHATLGIEQFSHLQINSSGGNGGAGGAGSNGGKGGKAKGCNAGDGGNGGLGGQGGNGGQGGDVTFRYWLTGNDVSVPVTNYGEGLIIMTNGGIGGTGGQGGIGGKGGRGKFEKRSTNITVTRDPGTAGITGVTGADGSTGSNGKFRIVTVPAQF